MTTKTHGLSKTREYWAWFEMKRRCTVPTNKSYSNYGGRGIQLCERWQTFAGFIADMGARPSPMHTIERVDNDGNYEPSNCRWAPRFEQNGNTRRNLIITYRSRSMTVAEAVRTAGNLVSRFRAYQRLKAGWSLEEAVETVPTRRVA